MPLLDPKSCNQEETAQILVAAMMNRLMLASLVIASIQACDIIPDVTHTFFGFPDNETPGPDIAFDCGRGLAAGGVGTFDDPLTFASAPGLFTPCEVIFDPFLRKFLRFEDICAQCVADFEAGIPHVDIWTGSSVTDGRQVQIDCEDSLTPAGPQSIIRSPNADLDVDAAPLFVPGASQSCNVDNVFPDADPAEFC